MDLNVVYTTFVFQFCFMNTIINRDLTQTIQERLQKRKKALILLGARQTGKSTLIKQLFKVDDKALWLNGDDPDVEALLHKITSTRLRQILADKEFFIIDEAQRIKDIGLKLKLITDTLPNIQVVATGSSSFELSNKLNEPLTGRKYEYKLFPLSYGEMVKHHGLITERRLLPQRLVYGYYPEIVNNPGEEKELLQQLASSYLYKDILMWEGIKKPEKLFKLLQALAFQMGQPVSYNELSQLCQMDNKTVEKYIQLLEQVFVIFRLHGLNRNMRNELKSAKKIYFYDNGIRNALIANFSIPEMRTDIGALWENFLISERMKYLHYSGQWVNRYFWRTAEQQEIDYVEESEGDYTASEFKWNERSKAKIPQSFLRAYPNSKTQIITPDNFEEFIGI